MSFVCGGLDISLPILFNELAPEKMQQFSHV